MQGKRCYSRSSPKNGRGPEATLPAKDEIEIVTYPGEMGELEAREQASSQS